MKIILSVGSLVLLAVAGCSAGVVDDDYGDSVRNMVQKQTYNPNAEAQASVLPKEGLMGDKAAAAMKTYRSGTPLGPSTEPVGSLTSPAGAAPMSSSAPTASR